MKQSQLPLKMLCKVKMLASSANMPVHLPEYPHLLSLHVVSNAAISWRQLLQDLNCSPEQDGPNVAVELMAGNEQVTLSAVSKGSHCRIEVRAQSFHSLAFVSVQVIPRLVSYGARFDTATLDQTSFLLPSLCELMDQHLSKRQAIASLNDKLLEEAAQLRTIEKRFLIKLKERNPPPLAGLEHLLHHVHSKVSRQAISAAVHVKVSLTAYACSGPGNSCKSG